jgi:hypothetical protein
MKYHVTCDVESGKLETVLDLLMSEVSNIMVAQSPCQSKPQKAPKPFTFGMEVKSGDTVQMPAVTLPLD